MCLTFGSSNPERSKYSFLGIINAAKLAVYKERKTTANKAQMLFMNLKNKIIVEKHKTEEHLKSKNPVTKLCFHIA